MKIKKLCLLLLVVYLLLFCLPGMCSAEMNQEEKQNLQTLKIELTELQKNNAQLATNSEESDRALTIAQEQLTASQEQTQVLKTQLATLKEQTQVALTSSKTAEKDLQDANQLLRTWKKEQDQKIAEIKKQNKALKILLVGLGVFMAFK